MPEIWFAVPGDPETLTGGYVYARRLSEALMARGIQVHAAPLPGGFPFPTVNDLAETRARLRALPAGATVLVDGLAYGVFPADLLQDLNLRVAALVHHPLARETGLDEAAVRRFTESERAALAMAQTVIATSRHTAAVLASAYGVPADRIHVALPGTEPKPRARGGARVPMLLTVATLTPRKGHADLVQALSQIGDLSWRSVMVGSLERTPETVSALRAQIARSGVADRITLAGELAGAALDRLYDEAAVFVLPSHYEGYGMAFAEALARGLPVVGCAAGAVTDTVPGAASLLVPPGDVAALADALRALLVDQDLRQRKAEAAWQAGKALPTWQDAAAVVARALGA